MYSGPGEQRDTRQITERHSDLVGNSAAGGKRAGKCELVSRTKASSRSNSGRRVAGGLVDEGPRHGYGLQLPIEILVKAADADIADTLTVHGPPPRQKCQD
jgi:hypothetical protein